MSEPAQDAPEVDLERLDVLLRPVRRVLARGRGRAPGPWLTHNLSRLLGDALALPLPAPVASGLEEARARLVEDGDGDALAEAWQLVQRVDATLGLPLPPPRLRSVRRRLAAQARVDAPVDVEDDDEDDDAEDAGEAGSGWPALHLGLELAALPLDEDVLGALLGAGLGTVQDVLWRRPVAERVLSPIHGAGRALPEGTVAIGGRVTCRWTTLAPDGRRVGYVRLHGAGDASVAWARPLDARELAALPLDGRVVVAAEHAEGVLSGGRRVPSSGGTAVELDHGLGEAAWAFEAAVAALTDPAHAVEEVLPTPVLSRLAVERLPDALRLVHARGAEARLARRRLAVSELLSEQLARSWARFREPGARGVAHTILHEEVATLERSRRALDDDAQSALERIKRELRRDLPMRRLLTGDAAAGVGELTLRTVLMVAQSRSQVVVLCVDDQAALVQHDLWSPDLRALGHVPMLLLGAPRSSEADALRRGEAHVVFAGPGVELASLELRRLGLVVIDELGAPSARLDEVARRRGPQPDVLVTWRTPVPRGLLDGQYADLDVSWLSSQAGVARGTVCPIRHREEAYRALATAAGEGRSVLVAFPLARAGGDLLDVQESGRLLATLSAEVFGGRALGLYHGGLTPVDRARALADFVERRVRVLVATTRIELSGPMPRGVDVMIDHADHVDVERLLALRALATPEGRMHYVVADEGGGPSRAVIAPLAEGVPDRDVAWRLPRVPVSPSPWPWHDAAELELALQVRDVAHEVLAEDPQLREGHHARLHRHLHELWLGAREDKPPWPIPRPQGTSRRRRRRRRRR